ncbi:MAG: GMC oxidoreductase [Roseicyclus sp.]
MFVDPGVFRDDILPPVVIIGSGPAGMSLGVSLAERQIPCLILEAGDVGFVPEIQDDYVGETSGDPYIPLDVTRLRQFGGSSNHWAGWCRPLDAWDFVAVPSMGIPAWPIQKSDLDPYTVRANDILEVPAPVDRPVNADIYEADFVYSPPVNFGTKYENFVRTSPHLNVALRSAVTALHAENGRISRIEIADANRRMHRISPDYVVVACGGIENARLLLWSNEVSSEPVVAEAGALGRYWMEHPHEMVGAAMIRRAIHQNPLERGLVSLSVNPDRLTDLGALNAAVRLRYAREMDLEERIKRSLCAVEPDLLTIANAVAGRAGRCGEPVQVVWEQAPDAGNRVALSETLRDSFGKPQAHLMWRKTDQDYRTARVVFEMVAAHIVRSGAGIVRADPHLIAMGGYPAIGEIGGNHHMGGTRMSHSPAEGVVDADLRIHGMANAFVAGSSVFVRGGHANPTYTIVQLSLRLADHLAAKLGA